jgi:hypothetical protein
MDIKEIVEFLKSVNAIIIYGVALIIPLLKLLHALLEFREKTKQARVTAIENCFKNQFIESEEIRALCVETLEGFCFEKVTGIRAESSQFRSALITLHKKVSPSITWKIIKNALPYLIIKNGEASDIRELSKREKVENYFLMVQYLLFAGFFILFAFISIFTIGRIEIIDSIILLIISFIFLFFAIFFISLREPFKAVKILRERFKNEG